MKEVLESSRASERERERECDMSEANKDEAVKCLNIARKALYDLESIPGGVNSAAGKGCLSKARRFTEKANRLGGDSVKDQVNQVLAEIEQRRSGGASGSGRGRRGDSPSTSTQSQQDLRRRTGKRASASTSSSSQKADSGTPEQRALVKRINGCKGKKEQTRNTNSSCLSPSSSSFEKKRRRKKKF